MIKKILRTIFTFVVVFFLLQSCVSKKQVLYVQDINAIDVSQISSSLRRFQENDILKIDVTSLEPKASIPYNNVLSQQNNSVTMDLIQLNGYLVSKNKTINFPVLGVISVAEKTTKTLANYLKERLETGGHLKKPNVTVRLLNAKFTILGEVNQPGTYTFTENNMSLLQVLGLA